jgi:hypothetical protein
MVLCGRERSQIRDEQRDIFERRLLVFLEPEAEPAGSEAAVAVRLFPRDQCRQLERLRDRHAADLSRGHLGEDEIAAFQRPPKDAPSVALRGRRSSSLGPGRLHQSTTAAYLAIFGTKRDSGRVVRVLTGQQQRQAPKQLPPREES